MSSNIFNGGGDGADIFEINDTPISTPQKASPQTEPMPKSTTIYLKSNSKVQELASHPNITRRKSLTLAEFNPSHTFYRNCRRELELSYQQTETKPEQLRKKIAACRIYQLLLLNAWRKQKSQTSVILNSRKDLEFQNAKLEEQIAALHRFRNAESLKREEAVSNLQNMEQEFRENLNENKALTEENICLGNKMSKCEELLSELQSQTKNSKNELLTKHCLLETKKCQLAVEQNKIKRLCSEIKIAVTQGSMMETEVTQLYNKVDELQKLLLETELKLQDTMFNNNNFECRNKELFEKLITEISKRKTLENYNTDLKSNITLAQVALNKELNKGLWKKTETIMLIFLRSLKTIAMTLLPALPQSFFENY